MDIRKRIYEFGSRKFSAENPPKICQFNQVVAVFHGISFERFFHRSVPNFWTMKSNIPALIRQSGKIFGKFGVFFFGVS